MAVGQAFTSGLNAATASNIRGAQLKNNKQAQQEKIRTDFLSGIEQTSTAIIEARKLGDDIETPGAARALAEFSIKSLDKALQAGIIGQDDAMRSAVKIRTAISAPTQAEENVAAVAQAGAVSQAQSAGTVQGKMPVANDEIHNLLDKSIAALPDEVKPFFDRKLFPNSEKRRDEVTAVVKTLTKPENKNKKIRQRITPNNVATTILMDDDGNAFDIAGNAITLSKDDRVLNSAQLQGSTEDLGLKVTDTQAGDLNIRMAEEKGSVENFHAMKEDLRSTLTKSPDANAIAGSIAKLAGSLSVNAKSLARVAGIDVSNVNLDPDRFEFGKDPKFKQLKTASREVKTMALSLAFSLAVANGQTGRGLSDKDLAFFLSQIGIDSSDPEQIMASVDRTFKDMARAHRIKRRNLVQSGAIEDTGEFEFNFESSNEDLDTQVNKILGIQ